jgi:hypothetical protein
MRDNILIWFLKKNEKTNIIYEYEESFKSYNTRVYVEFFIFFIFYDFTIPISNTSI